MLHVVAINQGDWLQTKRTDENSWESYTHKLNGDLIKAVDNTKKFAQSDRFKNAYIKLKNIKPGKAPLVVISKRSLVGKRENRVYYMLTYSINARLYY